MECRGKGCIFTLLRCCLGVCFSFNSVFVVVAFVFAMIANRVESNRSNIMRIVGGEVRLFCRMNKLCFTILITITLIVSMGECMCVCSGVCVCVYIPTVPSSISW